MPTIPVDYIGGDQGKIAIDFHNGSAVVRGFIVRQTGSRRYVVSDGVDHFTVKLARTLADVQNLAPGYATIEVYPFVKGMVLTIPEHVHRIEQFQCFTVEGHRYSWKFAYNPLSNGLGNNPANQDGEANIAQVNKG